MAKQVADAVEKNESATDFTYSPHYHEVSAKCKPLCLFLLWIAFGFNEQGGSGILVDSVRFSPLPFVLGFTVLVTDGGKYLRPELPGKRRVNGCCKSRHRSAG